MSKFEMILAASLLAALGGHFAMVGTIPSAVMSVFFAFWSGVTMTRASDKPWRKH